MATKLPPVTYTFPLGVDNRSRETALPDGAVRDAVNVDIDRSGKALRRDGWQQLIAATQARSLWIDPRSEYGYYVDNGALTRFLLTTDVAEPIGTLLDPNASFCWHGDGNIYLCNSFGTWRIDGLSLVANGLPTPPMPTVATSSSGGMHGGWYQVTIAAYRTLSNGAEEHSGAPPARMVQVPDGGGIALSAIPTSAAVTGFRLYCTGRGADDDVLYEAKTVANGTTTAALGIDDLKTGPALETMHHQPLPGGQIIRSYRGRLYVADDVTVSYSQPLRYGLYHPGDDFVSVPGRITMMEPVEDGIYIGTERFTLFLSMRDPDDPQLVNVDRRGVVPGSALQAPGDVFAGDVPVPDFGLKPCWLDTEGVQIVGYPGGQIRRQTSRAIAETNWRTAASAYVEKKGIKQILTVMRQSGLGAPGSSAATSDTLTTTITRP